MSVIVEKITVIAFDKWVMKQGCSEMEFIKDVFYGGDPISNQAEADMILRELHSEWNKWKYNK